MPRRARALALGVALWLPLWATLPAAALELALPGTGGLSREVVENPGSYPLPVGPWADGVLPVLDVSGRVTRQAWRIDAEGLTTLQVMAPLATQLKAAGFETLFRCHGQGCGGFDFRFGTPVLPAPDMFVDLFDFRFLSARGPGRGAGPDYVSVLVSGSNLTSYVQITHVGAPDAAAPTVSHLGGVLPVVAPEDGDGDEATASQTLPASLPLPDALEQRGHMVLSDLDFNTGAVTLGPGPFASLVALAAYLNADPARRVALVGHTDAVGGLDGNIALSHRRADAVMARLIEAHGVPATQLEAGGMGYLSPIAPNLTPAGREANRRVEAVLLNTQ